MVNVAATLRTIDKLSISTSLRVFFLFLAASLAPALGAQPRDLPLEQLKDSLPGLPAQLPPKDNIDCRVYFAPPRLDFEFRFFSGYSVSLPVRQLAGPARKLGLKVRVTPLSLERMEPVSFSAEVDLNEIPENVRGNIEHNASFVVGPGRYSVEWFLLDTLGNNCTLRWEIEAKPRRSERNVQFSMAPGEVGDSRIFLFRPEAAVVAEDVARPLRIKVFLNFDPWRRRRAAGVRLFEFLPRIGALRALSRHPRIGELSMVAYSFQEQKVLTRHDLDDRFDFPALREAIDELSPALVSFEQLGKYKQRDFFTQMLVDELPSQEPVDAYIFIGPDAEFGRKPPAERLAEIGSLDAPVFALVSSRAVWKGLVGNTIKAYDGRLFRFLGPRDLDKSVKKLIAEIDQARAEQPSIEQN